MKLSNDEITKYTIAHDITRTNVIRLSSYAPSIPVLKLYLGLIGHGYKIEDIIAMRDSSNDRRLNQFPWHLLNKEDPYYQPEQDTE